MMTEALEKIVRSAINRALRAEVDPVLSFNIKHRLSEKDEAVKEAVAAMLALSAVEITREQVEFQHSYHDDDLYPPREFWHCRINYKGLSTDWAKYGRQQEPASASEKLAVEEFLLRQINNDFGRQK